MEKYYLTWFCLKKHQVNFNWQKNKYTLIVCIVNTGIFICLNNYEGTFQASLIWTASWRTSFGQLMLSWLRQPTFPVLLWDKVVLLLTTFWGSCFLYWEEEVLGVHADQQKHWKKDRLAFPNFKLYCPSNCLPWVTEWIKYVCVLCPVVLPLDMNPHLKSLACHIYNNINPHRNLKLCMIMVISSYLKWNIKISSYILSLVITLSSLKSIVESSIFPLWSLIRFIISTQLSITWPSLVSLSESMSSDVASKFIIQKFLNLEKSAWML